MLTLLASDRRPLRHDLDATVAVEPGWRGAVSQRAPGGGFRRAEPGPCGPLVLGVRAAGQELVAHVWGPAQTPAQAQEGALTAALGWAGALDDPAGFGDLVDAHPVLRRVRAGCADPRLSELPRFGEAFGRAVLAQLVQAVEGHRSAALLAAQAGDPAGEGLWCWPTGEQVLATPSWALRRCGVSLRGAGALHAGAVADRRLTATVEARDWPRLDALLQALPGVGPWTSAETRSALGDPDAVSVGDYNLPSAVGAALTGDVSRPRASWTDEELLALLAPFSPQRGRVVRLVLGGVAAGLLARQPRRAPRAALSAHRFW